MQYTPIHNYNMIIVNGFKKMFPILHDADPEEVANNLYIDASAFSGRLGGGYGGGEDDIRNLISAAFDIELSVISAREIKTTLTTKLRQAVLENNHQVLLYTAFGFERAASMAVVDLREVDWANPHRYVEVSDDDEEVGINIPEAINEWVEVLCEPSQTRSVVGNRTRNRERRKPIEQVVKSLFDGV